MRQLRAAAGATEQAVTNESITRHAYKCRSDRLIWDLESGTLYEEAQVFGSGCYVERGRDQDVPYGGAWKLEARNDADGSQHPCLETPKAQSSLLVARRSPLVVYATPSGWENT